MTAADEQEAYCVAQEATIAAIVRRTAQTLEAHYARSQAACFAYAHGDGIANDLRALGVDRATIRVAYLHNFFAKLREANERETDRVVSVLFGAAFAEESAAARGSPHWLRAGDVHEAIARTKTLFGHRDRVFGQRVAKQVADRLLVPPSTLLDTEGDDHGATRPRN